VSLEHFEGLLNKVTNVESLALGVVNLVTEVGVNLLEHVHHGQDLTVVGHEGLANSVGAGDEGLENFQSDSNDFAVTSV